MRKATAHYVLDIIEGTILLLLVVSGFIMWFSLPEGSEAGKVVILDRHTWIQAHRWLAVALLVFFSTHVLTHWTWLWFMTRKLFARLKKP
jgi:cytochrome b subunit of formate dehydrogenase